MRNRISKVLSFLLVVVMLTIVPGMAWGEETAPSLRCNLSSVTVKNGESTTVTVYYENTNSSNLSGWVENTYIADASFGAIADGAAQLEIAGCGTGVSKIHVYLEDNPEIFVDITAKVTPSKQEITQIKAVKYLSDRSFFYYDNEEVYVLNFSFKNANEERIKAPVTVDIKIINDDDETVYERTHYVTMNDFGTWTSSLYGERLLAAVYIDPAEIEQGTTKNGTVCFTLESDYWTFGESTVSTNELPKVDATEKCSLTTPSVPQTISYSSSSGKLYTKVKVDGITYEFEESYDGSVILHIYYSGQKTYDYKGDNNSASCKIGWKLYDAEGYVVDSGTTYTSDLETGEKFKNCEETIYNLEPGTYRLKILDIK